ncbi:tyrosine-protein phosphatase [Streptomyces sanyensis]|uniref:tyrosine-protein phosphatase n=1 Tax=Streptomyces sanyensis TaxID=568869 RepID=UPI003D77296A
MNAIPSTTVANLRDLGGIPLPGGHRVREGVLFRSGQLDRLDTRTDPAVASLGVRTVVDLRTRGEREERPDRIPPGARLLSADVLADQITAGLLPAAARLRRLLADPVAAERELGDGRAAELFGAIYRGFVTTASARASYRVLLEELARPEAVPLLFHCTAGKDRTGWAAAVVLMLLGAEREVVEAEYLAVNAAVREALAPLVEGFTMQGGRPETALALIGVVPEYLAAGLDEAESRYGSMEGYVRDGLGVSRADVAAVRERLVAPADG